MRHLLAILLATCLLLALSQGELIKLERYARAAYPETVDLSMTYLGTCQQFDALKDNIRISTLTGSCLPINSTAGFPDSADLSAHYLCTMVARNIAQVDFVEIFRVYGQNLTDPYVFSFVPNVPFRIDSAGVNYLRRPSCTVNKDFCSTRLYVQSCSENAVRLKKGFVVSNDVIYVIPRNTFVTTCSSQADSCCDYINSGYCPRNSTDTILDLSRFRKKKPQHYKYGHQEHGQHGGQQQYHHKAPHGQHSQQHKAEQNAEVESVKQTHKKKPSKQHKPKKAHNKPKKAVENSQTQQQVASQQNAPEDANIQVPETKQDVKQTHKKKPHKQHKPKKAHNKPKKAVENSQTQQQVAQQNAPEDASNQVPETRQEAQSVKKQTHKKKPHKQHKPKQSHKKPQKGHKKPAAPSQQQAQPTQIAANAPQQLVQSPPQQVKPKFTKRPKHHDEDYED